MSLLAVAQRLSLGPFIPKVINIKSVQLATDRSKETVDKLIGHEGWLMGADVGKVKGAGTPLKGQTYAVLEVYDERGAANQTGIAVWGDYVREGEITPQPTPQIYVKRRWVLELETWNSVTDLFLQGSITVATPPHGVF